MVDKLRSLGLSDDAIHFAQRQPGPLLMVLWRYGLINADQLDEMLACDWL
ncbi:MAG: DUF2949 domain-containing protein [Gloeomargaritaceae cyanobacterium C42_A2020_066]|nr:DUF2949 domain-containing protein [Gloeomargaritaceae cyanobacterium C42_A2020_066]